jgi:hypothetical protein
MVAVDSGAVLITDTSADVISTADLAAGAISSAVKALYDSSNTEEMSVLLENM